MAPDKPQPTNNPLEAARRLTAPVRQKRFYMKAVMAEENGRFGLRLDGKRAMTPGKNTLAVPHRHIAEAIAREWEEQGDSIDPASMPVTRLANSAIDGVASRLAEVKADVFAYLGADLLYYRAGEPEGLVERQRLLWDPIIDWAEKHFGARFVLAEGVMHVAQPESTLLALRNAVDRFDDPFELAGLSLATSLTGSGLIALAMAEGALDADAAWTAAHVDEDWNIEKWGEDSEAMARRAKRLADFRAAALALVPLPLAGRG
jgi:chaperone required for assembly of F1-ATPase